ncbi:MAG: hypothetical protein ABWZ25_11145 [Chitinophagaceae bacterium]
MNHKDKQFAGIWLDGKHALIISKNQTTEFEISARVAATDSQSGGSEHARNNGKHTEQLKYFKELSQQLTTFDEILVFGPGQAQEQLQHHLKEDAQFNGKQITLDTSGQLTDPQVIAKVRDFFKSRQS